LQLLFAADISFRRLYRSVAKQKLDLFQLASRAVAKPGASAAKVVWRQIAYAIVTRFPRFSQHPSKPQGTYQVMPGDTLSRISSKELGCACLWPALWRMNKSIIGDDPNHVFAGILLKIPRTSDIQQNEKDKATEKCRARRVLSGPKSTMICLTNYRLKK